MREKNDLARRIILYISVASAISGLFLGVYIIGRFSIFGKEIKEPEVQIAGVLLAAGLLGSVLDFILKNIVEDVVRKYLTEEKVRQIIYSVAGKVAEEKIEEANALKEAEIIENAKEKNNTTLDTVIVPTTISFNSIRDKKQYECPETYSFKEGLKYIAFYMHKKVIGYGEIVNDNYNKNINGLKIFHIKEFILHEVKHEKKGAYIQGKKYCSFSTLKIAKTTDQIWPPPVSKHSS